MDSAKILNGMDLGLSKFLYETPSAGGISLLTIMHGWFGIEAPYKNDIIVFLNSRQNPVDGSFASTHKSWGIVDQMFILSAYYYLGVKPAKSLDLWFENEASDWDHIIQDVQTYSAGNYWGHLFAYPLCWIAYYRKIPPWLKKYWELAENPQYKSTWMNNIHQRDHFIVPYIAFDRTPPSLEEILTKTLSEQQIAGSWAGTIGETGLAIWNILKPYDILLGNRSDLKQGMNKAIPFIQGCYKEAIMDGVPVAYFQRSPTNPTVETIDFFMGVSAAINTGLIAGDVNPTYRWRKPPIFPKVRERLYPFIPEIYDRIDEWRLCDIKAY